MREGVGGGGKRGKRGIPEKFPNRQSSGFFTPQRREGEKPIRLPWNLSFEV